MSLSFANKVRETSTTTGTGTYDLGGAATGYAGFVAAVGDAAVVTYRAQMGDDWEIGIGTITDAATDTLARTAVLETLVSGTYDNTSPSAVNWGAGTKTIDLVGPAQSLGHIGGWYAPHPGQELDGRWYSYGGIRPLTTAVSHDVQFFQPWELRRRAKIEIFFYVRTAQTGGLLIGLYALDVSGNPAALLESTTTNTNSTGLITFKTTAVYNPGWYAPSCLLEVTGVQTDGINDQQNLLIQNFGSASGSLGIAGQSRAAHIVRSYASGLLSPFSGTLLVDNNQAAPYLGGRPAT